MYSFIKCTLYSYSRLNVSTRLQPPPLFLQKYILRCFEKKSHIIWKKNYENNFSPVLTHHNKIWDKTCSTCWYKLQNFFPKKSIHVHKKTHHIALFFSFCFHSLNNDRLWTKHLKKPTDYHLFVILQCQLPCNFCSSTGCNWFWKGNQGSFRCNCGWRAWGCSKRWWGIQDSEWRIGKTALDMF